MADEHHDRSSLGFDAELQAVLTEGASVTDEVRGILTNEAGLEKAVRVERSGLSAAVDVDQSTSAVSSEIRGRPTGKPQRELAVAETLRAKLNASGADWGGAILGDDARGEDAVLVSESDPGTKLLIQVTMVDGQKWAEAARGRAAATVSFDDLADQVLASIQRHSNMVTAGLTLALDATNGDAHGLMPVATSFRERHTEAARALGWQSIWLVGIDDAHTVCLSFTDEVDH
jgi:hypothetical protein